MEPHYTVSCGTGSWVLAIVETLMRNKFSAALNRNKSNSALSECHPLGCDSAKYQGNCSLEHVLSVKVWVVARGGDYAIDFLFCCPYGQKNSKLVIFLQPYDNVMSFIMKIHLLTSNSKLSWFLSFVHDKKSLLGCPLALFQILLIPGISMWSNWIKLRMWFWP